MRPAGMREAMPCSRLEMSALAMACSAPAALRRTISWGVSRARVPTSSLSSFKVSTTEW